MTMKNAEGYPVPTEQEAIGNLTKEQNRYVRQIAVHIKEMLSFLGFELLEIQILDKKSKKKYHWGGKAVGHQKRK